MNFNLVVQVPFWHYERGSTIYNTDEIEKVLEHHSHFVTKVKSPELPESAISDDLQTRLGPEKSS